MEAYVLHSRAIMKNAASLPTLLGALCLNVVACANGDELSTSSDQETDPGPTSCAFESQDLNANGYVKWVSIGAQSWDIVGLKNSADWKPDSLFKVEALAPRTWFRSGLTASLDALKSCLYESSASLRKKYMTWDQGQTLLKDLEERKSLEEAVDDVAAGKIAIPIASDAENSSPLSAEEIRQVTAQCKAALVATDLASHDKLTFETATSLFKFEDDAGLVAVHQACTPK